MRYEELEDMRLKKYCKFLENFYCSLLDEKCFSSKRLGTCGFRDHYYYLQLRKQDAPLTIIIKKSIHNEVMKRWKDYATNLSPGKKQMTARPLEDGILEALKSELTPLNVQANVRKMFKITKGVTPIIDGILRKDGYPTTLISIKTWLGTDFFRESFGNAYFTKIMHGRRNLRFYVITLFPVTYVSKEWIELAKPYIDGVYSLSEKPYIDELVKELKTLYA